MKIAFPTRDGRIDDHFGHCAYYTIITLEDGRPVATETLASPQGCGCKSGIAPVLAQKGVRLMLAGNMGEGARNVLSSAGIQVIRGCSGTIEEVLAGYLAGTISDSGDSCHAHEDHVCHG